MSRKLKNVVLTGASGGLGRALVKGLAARSNKMLLCGRAMDRLNAAKLDAEGQGANVELCSVSLKETADFVQVLSHFDDVSPIDYLILNAGVKCGNTSGVEPTEDLLRVLDVNMTAQIQCIQAIVPRMRERGHGHIVIVGSIAAISPSADLLSYSASKAGITAYGTALRRNLRGSGVGVTVVYPGFIDTEMTDRHLGPTPFKVTAEDAARRIVSGLGSRRRSVYFPKRLWLAALAREWLPFGLADAIEAKLRARVLPDRDASTADRTEERG